MPPSHGYTHLFIVIDRPTRWPEAMPVTKTITDACADVLLLHWVSHFGIPGHITSDRGAQFTSTLWTCLASTLGVDLHQMSSYHLWSIRVVERLHRSLNVSLLSWLTSPSWTGQFPYRFFSASALLCVKTLGAP